MNLPGIDAAQATRRRLTSESLGDAALSKRLTEGALLAALVAVFLLLRPYRGIVGDSMLYLGWAAAGLDPDGIGRDPMWALDGQMRFSLFPFIARRLIAASSIDFAGMSLALLGVTLWACGLIALARALGEPFGDLRAQRRAQHARAARSRFRIVKMRRQFDPRSLSNRETAVRSRGRLRKAETWRMQQA